MRRCIPRTPVREEKWGRCDNTDPMGYLGSHGGTPNRLQTQNRSPCTWTGLEPASSAYDGRCQTTQAADRYTGATRAAPSARRPVQRRINPTRSGLAACGWSHLLDLCAPWTGPRGTTWFARVRAVPNRVRALMHSRSFSGENQQPQVSRAAVVALEPNCLRTLWVRLSLRPHTMGVHSPVTCTPASPSPNGPVACVLVVPIGVPRAMAGTYRRGISRDDISACLSCGVVMVQALPVSGYAE